MRNTNGVWATVYGCPYPWTAGAMILKYNDFYIYIHQSKMGTKKYAEHKRGVGNRLWLSIPLDGGRNNMPL